MNPEKKSPENDPTPKPAELKYVSAVFFSSVGIDNEITRAFVSDFGERRVHMEDFVVWSKNLLNKNNLLTPRFAEFFALRYDICESLIKWGMKANLDLIISPLYFATKNDRPEIIALLLKNHALLQAGLYDRGVLCHISSVPAAKAYLEAGVDVTKMTIHSFEKDTLLHHAAKNGNLELIRFLVENKANLEAEDNDSCTPLHFAVSNRQYAAVELLLELGAKPQAEEFREKSDPLLAAIKKADYDMARLLMEYGADPDFGLYCSHLPLFRHAVELDWTRMILLLAMRSRFIRLDDLRRDIEVNIQTGELLRIAIFYNAEKTIKLFIEYGFDINKKFKTQTEGESKTLLQQAIFNFDPDFHPRLGVIRFLLDLGSNPFVKDEKGCILSKDPWFLGRVEDNLLCAYDVMKMLKAAEEKWAKAHPEKTT